MRKTGYFANTGFVTSFHGVDISPKLISEYPSFYKNLFKEVDLITVNSEYTKSLLQKISSLNKVRMLPVGLDTSYFKKSEKIKNKNFTILFVGRLVEFKGPIIALKIINEIIRRGYPDVKIKIVGEGELMNDLLNYINQNKIEKNVELLGALPQKRVKQLMDTSDLFLFPGIQDNNGRAENQGLVIQEAQAMELPVVISDAGGMKYGILDGETGFVIKEKDIDAFADKIEFLVNNKNKRLEMGKNGRAYIIENYDSVILGDKLVEYYINLTRK